MGYLDQVIAECEALFIPFPKIKMAFTLSNLSLFLEMVLFFFCFFLPCFLYAEAKAGICLVMLVEDHADVIEDCLKSASSLIDCIAISDMGSQDKTVEKIRHFMRENRLLGKISADPWKNFGYNRTLAIKSAKELLLDLGFCLEKSYLLILDPEMQLHISSFFHKESLKEDAYLLLEQNAALGCCTYHPHFLRASLPWECIGVANEYWSCNASYSQE